MRHGHQWNVPRLMREPDKGEHLGTDTHHQLAKKTRSMVVVRKKKREEKEPPLLQT